MGRVLIIAEAGVNHNGSLKMAKSLVDYAKWSGADIIKFQTAKLDSLVVQYAPMAEYQEQNIGEKKTQRDMLENLLLDYSDFEELYSYCKEKEIEFLSTPFDIESIHFLEKMVRFWKIPSGEITNYPYLLEIARTGKPVVMSTGMSTLEEVKAAYDILKDNGVEDIVLLHCTTEYPAPYEEVNLSAMNTLKNCFGVEVGYSDHTKGIEISLAAVTMGATIIEKHFTLNRDLEGPDHKASLEPEELKELVEKTRNIELALGTGLKIPTHSEIRNKDVARKSIVAAKKICKGELFTEHNLTTKRPGNGVTPMLWNTVIGSKADKDYERDEQIYWRM